jgi:hypothetical protein
VSEYKQRQSIYVFLHLSIAYKEDQGTRTTRHSLGSGTMLESDTPSGHRRLHANRPLSDDRTLRQ